jgi:hypothetical protein
VIIYPPLYPKVILKSSNPGSTKTVNITKLNKSPNITGPDGIATLLHRIDRPQLLERFVDVAGTKEYDPRVRPGFEHLLDVYVKRRGANVEVCNALPTIALIDGQMASLKVFTKAVHMYWQLKCSPSRLPTKI